MEWISSPPAIPSRERMVRLQEPSRESLVESDQASFGKMLCPEALPLRQEPRWDVLRPNIYRSGNCPIFAHRIVYKFEHKISIGFQNMWRHYLDVNSRDGNGWGVITSMHNFCARAMLLFYLPLRSIPMLAVIVSVVPGVVAGGARGRRAGNRRPQEQLRCRRTSSESRSYSR